MVPALMTSHFRDGIGLGQERSEPAGERRVIEERPAVGRRAAEADDPIGAWLLESREGLLVFSDSRLFGATVTIASTAARFRPGSAAPGG